MRPSGISSVRPRLTRRELFRSALVAGGTTALLSRTGAHAASSRIAPTSRPLSIVWWGETEAVGIKRWIDDTLYRFEAETGVTSEAELVDLDDVVDSFTIAAESGQVPDVQFFWNGYYHMQSVWRGFLRPLNGLVSRSVLQRSGATRHSQFDGKQYRVGFYRLGFGITYNKVLFDKARLDADNPPATWDALLNACDRLRAAGTLPIAGGAKDGPFGDWFLTNALPQQLDSDVEALQLFIGNLDWREPRYHDHWSRLEELYRRGFLNDDITSRTMYEGIFLFDTGRAAMCFNTTASLPQSQAALGAGNIGFMVMPVFGKGKMAGVPIMDAQGFGIPTNAVDPQNAARLLEFMHSKERVQAYWTLSHQIPTDEAFDSTVIDDPFIAGVVKRWVEGNHVLTIEDLMPTKFWTDAMFVASQKIVAGQFTGAQAGELAHQVTEAWRASNPDIVNNYAIWGSDLGA
jgi:ABC-type glycerol-3-phosphate transport system substrate-binding protein